MKFKTRLQLTRQAVNKLFHLSISMNKRILCHGSDGIKCFKLCSTVWGGRSIWIEQDISSNFISNQITLGYNLRNPLEICNRIEFD